MRLRNNSKKTEWMGYVCPGGRKIDMPMDSEFECTEAEGMYLLRTLGAPNWLTLVEEGPMTEKVEVVEPVKEEEPKLALEKEEVIEDNPLQAERFCEFCDSKGKRHKLLCKRPK